MSTVDSTAEVTHSRAGDAVAVAATTPDTAGA
jgi:hypothetical protein